MTMKSKAVKFRRKPGAPLAPGVAAQADTTATTRQAAAATVVAEPKPKPAPEQRQKPPAPGKRKARVVKRGPAQDDDTLIPQEPDVSDAVISAATSEAPKPAEPPTEIDAIKREGLTGRQLRMARRIAQKEGLAVTSDYDAVRQLRLKGIDPFKRANMLNLVPAATADGAGGAAKPANLPQTVAPGKPPAVPEQQIQIPQDRAAEIYKIQRDIARRRKRKMALLIARLSFFVFLPTFICGWYFAVVATPMYGTKSEFVIQQAEAAAAGGLGGLFAGTGLAVQQDSTNVQSFLLSRDAMLRLDKDLGFKAHFSQDRIDPIQRLEPGATNEQAYRLYERNVKVGYDPTEGILKMEVVAASPEVSEDFSKALIGYAEEQVDNLTQRLREDQMAGALESFAAAEERVLDAQRRVLELQEQLGVLDPVSETSSLMSQITEFEVQLRTKQLELEQLKSNARPNQARVAGVEGDIARLEALVSELRRSMTEGQEGGASLARVSGELRIAEADLTTRQLLLQQAAQQLETARIDANRQVRYMAVGVNPVAPDEPTYPRVFENTALAFVIFAGIYLMISLTASVLREQVSA